MFNHVDERAATSIAIPVTLVVYSIGAVGSIMLLGSILYGPFISKSTMSFHLYSGVILALLSLILSLALEELGHLFVEVVPFELSELGQK